MKCSKKVLAIVFSVLMIFTSMPTLAVSALAEDSSSPDNVLLASYLTNGINNQFTNHNVSWDDASNAAYFSGSASYLELGSSKLSYFKEFSTSTGMTISLDVKIDSGCAGWGRVFDINNGANTKYLMLNGGSQGTLRLATTTNSLGDGKNECVINPSTDAISSDWNNVRLVLENGKITYILNGNVIDTKEDSKITDVLNCFNDRTFNTLLIGASAYGSGDGYFKGYIKNFKLYANNYGLNAKISDLVNAANGSAKTANSKVYFSGTDTDGYYNNILYSSSDNWKWTGNGSGEDYSGYAGNLAFKITSPANTVMLYDGKNASKFPVRLEAKANANKSRYFWYATPNTSQMGSDLTLERKWTMYTSTWNSWSGDSSQDFNFVNNGVDTSNRSGSIYINSGSTRFWNNYFVLSSSFSPDTDKYYNHYNTLAFDTGSSGDSGTISDKNNPINYLCNIYVINYKPIADAYDTVKNVAKNLGNADQYCQDSLVEYITAANKVLTFDPNTYFVSGNDYNGCASAIKDICENYLELAKNGPSKHTAGDVQVENEVKPTGLANGSYDEVTYCVTCGEELSRQTKSTDKLDTTAYYAAIEEAEFLATDEKYSAQSRQAYTDAVNNAKIDLASTTSMNDIDNAIQSIINQKELLQYATRTVEFYVQYVGEDSNTHIDDYSATTDKTIECELPSDYLADSSVVRWSVECKNSAGTTVTKKYGTTNNFVLYNDYYDAKVTCYVVKNTIDSSTVSETLLSLVDGKKVVDFTTISDDVTVVGVDGNTITLSNGATLTAPEKPFYKVDGFKLDGVDLANGSSFENCKTIQIEYKAQENNITISAGSDDIAINDDTTGSYRTKFDKLITATTTSSADENTAWMFNGNVIGYGASISFRASGSGTLTYQNNAAKQNVSSIDSFTFGEYKTNTVAVVCSMVWLGDNKPIEQGVIMTTKVPQGTADTDIKDYVINKGKKFQAVKTCGPNDSQYLITVSRTADTAFTMYAVSYMVIKDGDENVVIYSDDYKTVSYKQ